MANLTQLELTAYYCTAAQFEDLEYHYDRLWKHYLFMFKIKSFKLMFHYAVAQNNATNGAFPNGWVEFGANLPVCHVFNEDTFKEIMRDRNLNVSQIKTIGYKALTIHEIELFDQGNVTEYIKATFTLNEFVYASTRVLTV